MQFELTHDLLSRLFNVNSFPIEDGMIIFGLRGCLPVTGNQDFSSSHKVYVTDINHINPRCIIGQWKPSEKTLVVFPGSTVPHISYMKEAKEKNGLGANQLFTGFFRGYTLGKHNLGKPTEHDALRQTQNEPMRRTSDDLDYDGDDRIEIGNACDNIHAGWTMGVDSNFFGSAGCQVLVGYPAKKGSRVSKATGPYAKFIDNIFESKQKIFSYALLTGTEALKHSIEKGSFVKKYRFGSVAPEISDLQEALKDAGFYKGANVDDSFGPKMLEAVCAFQEHAFGKSADDGIIGPITAKILDIKLKSLYYYDWTKFELV